MTATLAGLALLVAVVALVVALLVMRQNADTVAEVRRHRLAHERATGTRDPERRRRDVGPPAGQPDRRSPNRYEPPTVAEVRADQPTDPGLSLGPATRGMPIAGAHPHPQPPSRHERTPP